MGWTKDPMPAGGEVADSVVVGVGGGTGTAATVTDKGAEGRGLKGSVPAVGGDDAVAAHGRVEVVHPAVTSPEGIHSR